MRHLEGRAAEEVVMDQELAQLRHVFGPRVGAGDASDAAEEAFGMRSWSAQPQAAANLDKLIEIMGYDQLCFSTDYPHWDYDDPSRVLPAGVSDANREAFYLGNARKLYGLA